MSAINADILATIPEDWKFIITDKLKEIINRLKDVETTPKPELIFSFTKFKFADVKVVIIGQDPYPDIRHAHGLAFSSKVGIPASLKNIYKCLLKSKLIDKTPETGDLTKWAERGILLLNRALTTIPGKPKQHEFWHDYTEWLVRKISKKNKNLIFMLWGNDAKSLKSRIKYGKILEWSHPSPMSRVSFADCDNFIVATELLKSEINWDPEVKIGTDASTDSETITSVSSTSEEKIRFSLDQIMKLVKTELEKEMERSAFLARYTVDLDPEDRHEIPDVCKIYTDGSCHPNNSSKDSKGGVCCYSPDADVLIFGQLLPGSIATNQRAEGIAIYEALKIIKSYEDVPKFIIVTDSQFWIDMFLKFMPNWEAKHTDFETKKNPDITKKIWKLYKSVRKRVEFRHINSHTKKIGIDYMNNEIADNVCHLLRVHKLLINFQTSETTDFNQK